MTDHRPLVTRRQVLSTTLFALPLLAAPPMVGARPGREACQLTARQSEGPFYPVVPIEARSNLVRPAGSGRQPPGKPIVVAGTLTDARCRPVANADVRLWQADAQGRYNHPGENSRIPLDSRFLYWGRTTTDSKGEYRFVTILPAAYRAGGNWMRPPHIHFKFRAEGAEILTTQMYFPNHPLNERDYLLRGVSARRRGALIARQLPAVREGAAELPAFRFDVVL